MINLDCGNDWDNQFGYFEWDVIDILGLILLQLGNE